MTRTYAVLLLALLFGATTVAGDDETGQQQLKEYKPPIDCDVECRELKRCDREIERNPDVYGKVLPSGRCCPICTKITPPSDDCDLSICEPLVCDFLEIEFKKPHKCCPQCISIGQVGEDSQGQPAVEIEPATDDAIIIIDICPTPGCLDPCVSFETSLPICAGECITKPQFFTSGDLTCPGCSAFVECGPVDCALVLCPFVAECPGGVDPIPTLDGCCQQCPPSDDDDDDDAIIIIDVCPTPICLDPCVSFETSLPICAGECITETQFFTSGDLTCPGCPIFVECDCSNIICGAAEDCGPGYASLTLPGSCCPECVAVDCAAVSCLAVTECPDGVEPVLDAGGCCNFCP